MKGYIKLHRKIVDTKWYRKSQYIHLWVHILLRASHSGSKWKFKEREYTIRPGQVLCSMRGLSAETGIPEMQCYRIIKKLENDKQISRRTYNKCSVLQILNWRQYQTGGTACKTRKPKLSSYNNDNLYKPLKPIKKYIS